MREKRCGISTTLLVVVALVPLALVLDFALLFVSFPNALEYVVAIDIPIFAAIGPMVFLSRRKNAAKAREVGVAPTTAMDRLKERNGGRRAPGSGTGTVPLGQTEEKEANVFLGETETQNSAEQVDQILQRMQAKEMDLGMGPIPETEAREQLAVDPEPVQGVQAAAPDKALKPGKIRNYSLSPEKLRVPAYVCRCGHAHRFVCLTCGMTVEAAAKKGKTHWVEWTPEMGVMP